MTRCPVCSSASPPFTEVDGHAFFSCSGCGLIHIDPRVLDDIDDGRPVIAYADDYWRSELDAARERAFGEGLARACEVFVLARRPIRRFLDVGTGPGLFLDAVSTFLPWMAERFHGVELFPPPESERTTHLNYRVGRVSDYPPGTFDGGLCMEVFEHLTPRMVGALLQEIADVAADEACFLINTGLADYTRNECPGYLDPLGCGHIVSWTVEAVDILGRPHGLTASPLPGRTWCFLLEKAAPPRPTLEERMAHPLPENLSGLSPVMGRRSPFALLAEAGLRASDHYAQFMDRTRWALSLDKEVSDARAIVAAAQAEIARLAPPGGLSGLSRRLLSWGARPER